jgi:tRNA-splicing ligase RtcB
MKKVNDHLYEVEKEGEMKVPVKIFASEKLMNKMQQDKCIEQGTNVAKCLPGKYDDARCTPRIWI